MINSAFLDKVTLQSITPTFLPFGGSFDNFTTVFGDAGFVRALGISLAVTLVTVAAAIVIAFLGALAISRFRFRGPALVRARPAAHPDASGRGALHRAVQDDELGRTAQQRASALALLYTAAVVPFTVWMLRGFVAGVPVELEEAAMVDGLSRTKAFLRITFPLLAPGLVASGVYAFLQAWNEFTVALVVMTEEQSRTLPLWLRGFVQASATRETDWGQVMAASTARRRAGHHLLPRRPGAHEQRPRRRGGEGLR